ncbi:unnamed protein product, partial [Timema podura]|nr:unnamed protein product [Timema podura]
MIYHYRPPPAFFAEQGAESSTYQYFAMQSGTDTTVTMDVFVVDGLRDPFIGPPAIEGIPGVVRFLTAEDIPGKNSFTPALVFLFETEEIFCSGKVLFAGQPVGLIVAETQQVANMAAQKVKIEYTNVKKPVILLREAAKSKDPNIVVLEKELKPKVVKG